MTKGELKSLLKEADLLLEAISKYKEVYKRLDEITEEIVDADADLARTGFQIIDNFEEKRVVWKSCGVRRFELKRAR